MVYTASFAICLLALLCIIHAEEYTVQHKSVVACTFELLVKPAEDFSYIDITYSTKGATGGRPLLSHAGPSITQQRCYIAATINHPNRTARARPLRMELKGNAELGKGLALTIETGLLWGNMAAMTNFTSAIIQGPVAKSAPFSRNVTIANRAHPTSCGSSRYGDISHPETLAQFTEPQLVSTFSISGNGGAGTLGEDGELNHRIFVEWLDGCGSYTQWIDCVTYDRYDNPSYAKGPGGIICIDDKGNPNAVDWSKPPPPDA